MCAALCSSGQLDNLDSHKATGPDNIPTEMLKQLIPELSPALTMIFEASLQQAIRLEKSKHFPSL